MAQQKLHKTGEKLPRNKGGGTVQKTTQQGTTSKKQVESHSSKNRSVNHGRHR